MFAVCVCVCVCVCVWCARADGNVLLVMIAGEQVLGSTLPLEAAALRRPPASKSIPIPSNSEEKKTERNGDDEDQRVSSEVGPEDSGVSTEEETNTEEEEEEEEEEENEVKVEEKKLLMLPTTPSEERKILMTQSCPETASSKWFDDDEQEECCCICLEPFDENNPAKLTKCGHEYHLQCIMQWYQRNSCCPMCGMDVELVEEEAQSLLACVERRLSLSPSQYGGAGAVSGSHSHGNGNNNEGNRLNLRSAHHRPGMRGDIPYPAATSSSRSTSNEGRRSFSVIFPSRVTAEGSTSTNQVRRGSGSLSLANFRKTTSGFFRKLRSRSSSNQ